MIATVLYSYDQLVKEKSHMSDKDVYDFAIEWKPHWKEEKEFELCDTIHNMAIRPAILILDDTTSAVDMETEKHIQESLEQLDFSCTKIIIVQRISSTRKVDKIIVLRDGEIEEEGTHQELIAKKGYYYELVKLQGGEEVFEKGGLELLEKPVKEGE